MSGHASTIGPDTDAAELAAAILRAIAELPDQHIRGAEELAPVIGYVTASGRADVAARSLMRRLKGMGVRPVVPHGLVPNGWRCYTARELRRALHEAVQ